VVRLQLEMFKARKEGLFGKGGMTRGDVRLFQAVRSYVYTAGNQYRSKGCGRRNLAFPGDTTLLTEPFGVDLRKC
jgi:hypothetical protein